jgi:tetratricopeptide (TPR) repeat protein
LSSTDLDDPLLQKANALFQAGRLGEAAAIYRDLLLKSPGNVLVMHLLALVAMHMDNAPLVLSLAETAIGIEPGLAVLYQDKAAALRRLGRKQEALAAIEEALRRDPGQADFYDTLAAIKRDLRFYEEAAAALQHALRLEPDSAKFHNNLGICYSRMGRLTDAVASLETVIRILPHSAEAHNNLGNTLKSMGRYDEAKKIYAKALAIKPDVFMGAANKGMCHLVTGDWAEGFRLFEERKPDNMPPEGRRFDAAKRWKGQSARTQTIILYNEQGLGDSIQFSRYIPMVQERLGHVVVQMQSALVDIMRANYPGVEWLAEDTPPPPHEWQCPLMSLPYVFGTRPDKVPGTAGYLKVDENRIAEWRGKLPQDGKRKVGLVWAGNPNHMNDHIRSIPFPLLAPLWDIPDVHYFSLQKGGSALDPAGLPASFTQLGDTLRDFTDTGAVLTHLDLLVSVDTSVLHLAGALGRPAWGLLQFDPDWRWIIGRDDTPWYDSVRLFRQKTYNDWADILARVSTALRGA